MSYATHADIEERLGTRAYVQLTDDEGTGSADEDKVTEALEGAEGEVNSYLGRRHAVPVDVGSHLELAAVLRSVTLDLVEYRLHARRPPVRKDLERKREHAIRWLEQVATGQAVLPTVSEVRSNSAGTVTSEVVGPQRVMSRDELEDL